MDFSKLREGVFAKHPDWAYRDKNGDVVNYNGNIQTCPNGAYQKEKSLEILREVLTTHPFDGVFCNMSGFLVVDYSGVYHGPCHCENCKRLFKEQYGLDIPDRDDPRNPDYRKYAAFKSACTKAQRERLIQTVRSISSELAINNVDYIRTESATEIGVPQWQYSASCNARARQDRCGCARPTTPAWILWDSAIGIPRSAPGSWRCVNGRILPTRAV